MIYFIGNPDVPGNVRGAALEGVGDGLAVVADGFEETVVIVGAGAGVCSSDCS